MAIIQLKRKGFRAFYKTPKLVINFQTPEGECLYDNCGQVTARRLQFSWEIKARQECFGIMRTVQRLSASVINYVGNTDTGSFSSTFLGGIMGNLDASRTKTYFGNLPQNGVQTRGVVAPTPLSDECNTVHGREIDQTYERFIYTPDCVYQPAFQFSMTHAADDSLNGSALTSNINALGGTFLSAISDAIECPNIDSAIAAIWGPLTSNPVTLNLGAYE